MIPAEFDYVAPDHARRGAEPRSPHGGEDAKLIAGGHSLLPLMKLRLAAPTLLVDLRRVPGLTRDRAQRRRDDRRHDDAHGDRERRSLGLIAEVSSTIADPQVRNRGTLGGSLAHGDPASDQPAILLAYEGSVTVRGASRRAHDRGRRPVPGLPHDGGRRRRGADLGQLPGARRLRVRLPEVQPPQGGLGDGRRLRARQEGGDGTCEDVRIGLTHMSNVPLRATAAEDALRGGALDAAAIARGRRAGRRGHQPARRPQRLAGLQAPPGARAVPARARGGGGVTEGLGTPADVTQTLAGEGYLADRGLATAVYLAAELEQPLLLEGEAGVGKTEVARALAGATGARLIRLQCHEGIDLHHAVYDWDYGRQLLAIRAAEARRRGARAVRARVPAAAAAARGARGGRPVACC